MTATLSPSTLSPCTVLLPLTLPARLPACRPACLPTCLPPSPPPAHAFAAGDPHNSTRVAAFREASGLKTLKCLKSDEQLKWSGEAWTAVTDTDAETIAAELTSNLAKYKGCAVRVAA